MILTDTKRLFCAICTLLLVLLSTGFSHAGDKESTYSISLTKTAEIAEDIQKVGDKKVLTETHVIQEGEHVWQLLREKGLLKKRNLSDILTMLKKLNASFDNLDLVHPGQKIVIPLKIVPLVGFPGPKQAIATPVTELKDVDLESYTVKPGDSISRVVQGRYDIPAETLYTDYLEMVKKLNPSLKDVDTIYPGQKIRLPIYSPKVVRRRIEPPAPRKTEESDHEVDRGVSDRVAAGLSSIFRQMGEEWVGSGQHFIPLESGGQIDLNAKSFPVVSLHNGERVIVDLYGKLPERMARLIVSSWGNYRVVRLLKGDSLRSALGKVLDQCRFPKIFEKGHPLELGGEVPLSITGDWVVVLSETPSDGRPAVAVINLAEGNMPGTPPSIKNYLEGLGIKVIDYPPTADLPSSDSAVAERLKGAHDPLSLVRTLLDLTGQSYSTKVEIPVYDSENADFQLMVKADFLLKVGGADGIIDLSGIDPQLVPFLQEHHFKILSLGGEMEPLTVVSKTLAFLGIKAESGLHSFLAAKRDESKNIRISVKGVVFPDPAGHHILATPNTVPDEIAVFLSQKQYKILPLT